MPREQNTSGRWTGTFERLPEEKRQRILGCAKTVFARSGYAGANINEIARNAGISIGALYKYFRTKEDLFLALIEDAHDILETKLDEILRKDEQLTKKITMLLDAAVEFSLQDPELIQLYIGWTTQELVPLSENLSRRVEGVASSRYIRLVKEAKEKGEVRIDLDEGMTAFCLDNLFLMVQFAFASDYYKERLKLYSETGALPEKERIVRELSRFISNALLPPTP